jgi:ceramide glucosyltransferase
MVLDDDTHLPAETAATLVQHAKDADIATGLPHYMDGRGLSASLLAQFVNNNSAMTYLSLLPFLPPVSINGMCYAMRREKLGIFHEIRLHLTDDLALAIAMLKRGGWIHQSGQFQQIAIDVRGVRQYLRMMHRWHLFALLLIKEQSVGHRLLIFLMYGWHPLLLWCAVIVALAEGSWLAFGILALFLGLRSALLIALQRAVFGRSIHRSLVSVVSELLQPLHLLHAALDSRIHWRGKIYQVSGSDRFVKS